MVASPAEVERVFDVPLRDLADPEIFHEERWSFPGEPGPGQPDGSFAVWFFEVEGEMIWGATARMIHELLRVVLLPPADGGPSARPARPARVGRPGTVREESPRKMAGVTARRE